MPISLPTPPALPAALGARARVAAAAVARSSSRSRPRPCVPSGRSRLPRGTPPAASASWMRSRGDGRCIARLSRRRASPLRMRCARCGGRARTVTPWDGALLADARTRCCASRPWSRGCGRCCAAGGGVVGHARPRHCRRRPPPARRPLIHRWPGGRGRAAATGATGLGGVQDFSDDGAARPTPAQRGRAAGRDAGNRAGGPTWIRPGRDTPSGRPPTRTEAPRRATAGSRRSPACGFGPTRAVRTYRARRRDGGLTSPRSATWHMTTWPRSASRIPPQLGGDPAGLEVGRAAAWGGARAARAGSRARRRRPQFRASARRTRTAAPSRSAARRRSPSRCQRERCRRRRADRDPRGRERHQPARGERVDPRAGDLQFGTAAQLTLSYGGLTLPAAPTCRASASCSALGDTGAWTPLAPVTVDTHWRARSRRRSRARHLRDRRTAAAFGRGHVHARAARHDAALRGRAPWCHRTRRRRLAGAGRR